MNFFGAIRGIGPLTQHGLGGSGELPVPMMFAVVGATWALTLSFAVVAWAWREPRFVGEAAVEPPPRRHWLAVVGLVVAAVVFGELFTGPHTDENHGLGLVYIVVWVGLVPLALIFGHVWRDLSPWRTVQGLVGPAVGRRDGVFRYPRGLGYWPAAVGLFAFGWLELASPDPASVTAVRTWVSAYAAITVIGGVLFGPVWYDRADPFDVYSAIVAKASPFVRDGRWAPHNPLRSLVTIPIDRGLLAVIATLLGSTAFDSFSDLTLWQRGHHDVTVTTAALLGFCVAAAMLFGLATMSTGGISLRERPKLPAQYAHSLVPIAIGYVLAHYLTALVGQGPELVGLPDMEDFVSAHAGVLAVVKVTLVVLGHVLAVLAAHDRALVLLPRAHRLTGQLTMLVLMVGYTFVGLFLLLTT